MHRKENRQKKRRVKWKTIIGTGCIAALLVLVFLMYGKLAELTNQLSYLQDTTNIILSEVGGMQSDIEKTLEKEASMVESYSIEIVDMDFTWETYDVEISVIPKEYTDKTKVSIFFGTKECPLKLEGYTYKGSITLPLNQDFDGNVTFLLSNDKKKTTEVLEGYAGLDNQLDQVLSGALDEAPSYKDGELHLNADCTFALNGIDRYEFESLEIVAQLEDEEIWTQDLLTEIETDMESDDQNSVDKQLAGTESGKEPGNDDLGPVNGGSGSSVCKFDYGLQQDGADIMEQTQHIRIYLRAVSTEGYRFEYDLFGGDYLAAETRMDKDSFDWTHYSVVYDRKGGKLELNDK